MPVLSKKEKEYEKRPMLSRNGKLYFGMQSSLEKYETVLRISKHSRRMWTIRVIQNVKFELGPFVIV